MMKNLVEEFPNHLREALQIGRSAQLHPCNKSIHNIVISGLGGSGIGGKIVSQLVAEKCPVPIVCTNDYVLPDFVNEHTLVIISSYSGDLTIFYGYISNSVNVVFGIDDCSPFNEDVVRKGLGRCVKCTQ